MQQYDANFYQGQYQGSVRSALKYLSHLFAHYQPSSVVDFGCGVGSWLYAAGELGVESLTGLDGSWVQANQLLSSSIDFRATDFETASSIDVSSDLAISVEVAEHFDQRHADHFVTLMTSTADLIIFGAAIPFQGGTNHVNEQPQSYWIEKFGAQDYACFDFFRPVFWNDVDVESWYRQNTFLFVKRSAMANYSFLNDREAVVALPDIVHPELFARKAQQLSQRQRADVLRDAALAVEQEDVPLALSLMSKALDDRPEGVFIKERCQAYREALQKK